MIHVNIKYFYANWSSNLVTAFNISREMPKEKVRERKREKESKKRKSVRVREMERERQRKRERVCV